MSLAVAADGAAASAVAPPTFVAHMRGAMS